MLSKEEIETCKEELLNYIEFMESAGDNAGWARGLKWYIEQLEASNMTATKCVSIQQNAYWQGYAERDKKAQQICKECKYRKKLKQAEINKRKLIEYIEKKICEYDETIIELVLQNVLEVAKGEKDVK